MVGSCPVRNLSHVETPTMKPRLLAYLSLPTTIFAQSTTQASPTLESKLPALEAAAKSAQSAGDNAWMLMSAALVLMMTGPGGAHQHPGIITGALGGFCSGF